MGERTELLEDIKDALNERPPSRPPRRSISDIARENFALLAATGLIGSNTLTGVVTDKVGGGEAARDGFTSQVALITESANTAIDAGNLRVEAAEAERDRAIDTGARVHDLYIECNDARLAERVSAASPVPASAINTDVGT